jgi:hypothetical protein
VWDQQALGFCIHKAMKDVNIRKGKKRKEKIWWLGEIRVGQQAP